MSVDIDLSADEPGEVEIVNLGTDRLQFQFPKVAPLLSAMKRAETTTDEEQRAMIRLQATERWLQLGFGNQQWEHIQKRLATEGDPLDFKHVQQMFRQLFEKASGQRPPTWRGDSSAVSPQAFQREVGQSQMALMPDLSGSVNSAT